MAASIPTVRRLRPGETGLFRALLGVFATAFDEPETYLARQPSDAYLEGLLGRCDAIALVALDRGAVGAPSSAASSPMS